MVSDGASSPAAVPSPGGSDAARDRGPSTVVALLASCHPGPVVAVTALTALLCVPAGLSPGRAAVVVLAVLAGQLGIGWSNDLLDAARDRQVGRHDKPVASGAVAERTVRVACAGSLVVTAVASLAVGLLPGVVHLGLVACGWAYNLGLKATPASWLPYALAFGGLPAFAWLAGGAAPPVAVVVAGALLGVGAHLLNVVPDLDDDLATDVRGLPHRLGARASSLLAVTVLVAASAVVALGGSGAVPLRVVALVVAVALAGLGAAAGGRTAFRAAIAIAALDLVLLVVAG